MTALAFIDPNSNTQIARSTLPAIDDPQKMGYLELRACLFTQQESMALCGISHATLKEWRRTDNVFKHWETYRLADLQTKTAKTLTYGRFMRNLHLILKLDENALIHQLNNPDKMTPDQKDWAREAAKRYRANDLAMMEKVLNPESNLDIDRGSGPVNIQVNISGDIYNDALAGVAASKMLLEQFTRKNQIIDGEAIVIDTEVDNA